jgi:hypothetical protein
MRRAFINMDALFFCGTQLENSGSILDAGRFQGVPFRVPARPKRES